MEEYEYEYGRKLVCTICKTETEVQAGMAPWFDVKYLTANGVFDPEGTLCSIRCLLKWMHEYMGVLCDLIRAEKQNPKFERSAS